MLHDFIATNHSKITTRTKQLLVDRGWPLAPPEALDHGVPMFLTQVSATLERETTVGPFGSEIAADTATRHGGDLLALGFTVSQVVHAYGDICQVVTKLAIEENAQITGPEFQILNRCLDVAIADAVTEHARQTAKSRSADELERLGRLVHEMRNLLNTASLAYQMLKRGDVAINGSTGGVLGRSLTGLSTLVESTLSDVRITAHHQRNERLALVVMLADIATAAHLDAARRGLQFSSELPAAELWVDADPQLLASAVNNLLNNAFKYTRPGSAVILRAQHDATSIVIEVEDQCGGFPTNGDDPFRAFGERRSADGSGLGLGLSVARRAVRASGGDVRIRNRPGHGCVFAIDLAYTAAPTGARQ